ncbi:MAG: hypothetical protein P4L69_06845 [Desulfosporosinus sp.]|nr:hypothetical protein [Desulfosporosinus sp.]
MDNIRTVPEQYTDNTQHAFDNIRLTCSEIGFLCTSQWETLPVMSPIDPETIKDKFMYRNILSWELTSLDIHVRAIIETIRNDSLRKLWSELLNTELEYYDKYLKYGKMKGWTRVVPIYGEPVT